MAASGNPPAELEAIEARAEELNEQTRLSPREAQCWAYREQDYKEREIGDALGIETGTVSALLRRARKKLAEARRTVAYLDGTGPADQE